MANGDEFRDVHLSIYAAVTRVLSPRRTRKQVVPVPVVYVPIDREVDRAVDRAMNFVVLATLEEPPVPGLRRYLKTVVR